MLVNRERNKNCESNLKLLLHATLMTVLYYVDKEPIKMEAGFQEVLFSHVSHIQTCLSDIHDECCFFVSKAARDSLSIILLLYIFYKNIRRNAKLIELKEIEFHFYINWQSIDNLILSNYYRRISVGIHLRVITNSCHASFICQTIYNLY